MPSHHDWDLDNETWAGGAPDDDPDIPCCPVCGADMEWIECHCEEGYYHDCGEDCCSCADPEPDTPCPDCHGQGGWMECTALPHSEEQMAKFRARVGQE